MDISSATWRCVAIDSLSVTSEIRSDGDHSSEALSLNVGARLWLLLGQCDPTVNLYEKIVCLRNNKIDGV